jgi:lipoyl(octanoyl) transferase
MNPNPQPAPSLEIQDWGLTRYVEAFERQKVLVDLRRRGSIADHLVFTQHQPVYTLGLRKGADRHLIWDAAACQAHGIEVVRSNRGGDITYHGPGQLVGYPIISLQARRDLHAYLRDLESVVIKTLKRFGLSSQRRSGKTGIWLGSRKICAIGVAVRSWVTYHGFALNVNTDMKHFAGIVPCGISDASVTSMADELAAPVDLHAVQATLAVEFKNVFPNT